MGQLLYPTGHPLLNGGAPKPGEVRQASCDSCGSVVTLARSSRCQHPDWHVTGARWASIACGNCAAWRADFRAQVEGGSGPLSPVVHFRGGRIGTHPPDHT